MTTARDSSAADSAPWARPLYERRIAYLGELAEMGMELARDIKAQDQADLAQIAIAFGRTARAVRLTLMLQARFIEALEARDLYGPVPPGARTDCPEPLTRIERIIVDVADRDRDEAAERLVRETAERLDRDDMHRLMDRPVSELVAPIRKDLGLDPDWPLKSSPIGGGGPDEASAKSGGGGMREAGTDVVVPLHQTLRVRSPSPDGGGIERDPVLAPP